MMSVSYSNNRVITKTFFFRDVRPFLSIRRAFPSDSERGFKRDAETYRLVLVVFYSENTKK